MKKEYQKPIANQICFVVRDALMDVGGDGSLVELPGSANITPEQPGWFSGSPQDSAAFQLP